MSELVSELIKSDRKMYITAMPIATIVLLVFLGIFLFHLFAGAIYVRPLRIYVQRKTQPFLYWILMSFEGLMIAFIYIIWDTKIL